MDSKRILSIAGTILKLVTILDIIYKSIDEEYK